MRIALAILVLVVAVYLAVRFVQRRLGGAATPPPPRPIDPAAEAAYRRAVRERAERQRRGVSAPDPRPPRPTVTFDEGVFACDEDSPAEYFVVVSKAPDRSVAAAVQRASDRFMLVDELGREHADGEALDEAFRAHTAWDLYTPNYTAVPRVTPSGVEGYVDCKGVIPEAMGETFRRIMREELGMLNVPSLVRMNVD